MQKNNLIIAFTGIILILGVLFSGCTNSPGTLNPSKEIVNASLNKNFSSNSDRFSVSYPDDWNISLARLGSFNRSTIRLNGDNETRVTVNVNSYVPNKTLSGWVNWWITDYSTNFQNYHVISEENTTLDGNPAVQIISTEKLVLDLKTMKVITVVNGTMYEITYAAPPERFDNNSEVAAAIIKSIKLSK